MTVWVRMMKVHTDKIRLLGCHEQADLIDAVAAQMQHRIDEMQMEIGRAANFEATLIRALKMESERDD